MPPPSLFSVKKTSSPSPDLLGQRLSHHRLENINLTLHDDDHNHDISTVDLVSRQDCVSSCPPLRTLNLKFWKSHSFPFLQSMHRKSVCQVSVSWVSHEYFPSLFNVNLMLINVISRCLYLYLTCISCFSCVISWHDVCENDMKCSSFHALKWLWVCLNWMVSTLIMSFSWLEVVFEEWDSHCFVFRKEKRERENKFKVGNILPSLFDKDSLIFL